jgi:hypothetical protein
MKTVFFTADDGAFNDVVPKLYVRFQSLNKQELRVLTPQDFNRLGLRTIHWVKAYLWDFVDSTVDAVGWVDADVIPLRPMEDLSVDGIRMAFRPPDHPITKQALKDLRRALNFKRKLTYCNAGVLLASRKAIPVFDRLKRYMREKPEIRFYEQSYLNLALAEEGIRLDLWPSEYNWTPGLGPVHDGVVFWHFPGGSDMKKLLRDEWDKLTEAPCLKKTVSNE